MDSTESWARQQYFAPPLFMIFVIIYYYYYLWMLIFILAILGFRGDLYAGRGHGVFFRGGSHLGRGSSDYPWGLLYTPFILMMK